MNKQRKLFFFFYLIILLSCTESEHHKAHADLFQCPMKCEGNKVYKEAGKCPVCEMDLKKIESAFSKDQSEIALPAESIFHLNSEWRTEENKRIHLADLKGKTLIIVMIYTSCKAACPRLVADMKHIEEQIPDSLIPDINFVLVSIDPKVDTPKRLKEFAQKNQMDGEQWTFLNGSQKDIDDFANVLAVQYKRISPIDFSHSSIISVFNPKGELMHQQEGLGVDSKETVERIIQISQESKSKN